MDKHINKNKNKAKVLNLVSKMAELKQIIKTGKNTL